MSKTILNASAPEFRPETGINSSNWRNPNNITASSNIFKKRFNNITNNNNKTQSKQINKNREPLDDGFWGPISSYLPSYRCKCCNKVMSRKEPSKFPQKIYSCGHIVCANCIVKSYYIDLQQLCPVYNCNKCVNPLSDAKPVEKLNILSGIEEKLDDDYINVNNIHNEYENNSHCLPYESEDDYEKEFKNRNNKNIHHCGDPECEWDCGELWCGCIDICRGSCGFGDGYESRSRWW